MNAYEKRKRERELKAAARRKVTSERRSDAVDYAIRAYEKAYYDRHGVVVKPRYINGWVLVHHRRIRVAVLEKMTKNLYGQIHELELNTPEQSL